MAKVTKRIATTPGGVRITLNVSDEICLPLGFRAGSIVFDPNFNEEVVVAGAAPKYSTGRTNVLWFFEKDGAVVNYGSAIAFEYVGFYLIKDKGV